MATTVKTFMEPYHLIYFMFKTANYIKKTKKKIEEEKTKKKRKIKFTRINKKIKN